MDLSPEAVRAIAGALAPHDPRPAGAASPADHRRDPRVNVRGSAVIIPYPDRTGRRPVRVSVHDLSARGIGFEHAEQLYPGEWFILHLPRTAGPDCPRALLCAVMHWDVAEVVPESSTGAVLGLAALGLLTRRRSSARS